MVDIKKRLKRLEETEKRRSESRAMVGKVNAKDHIAEVYHSLHDDIKCGAHTFYNLPGGRGSAKSSFASLEIVAGIMDDPTGETNAIVFRYVGATLRESVFSQIAWAIDTLGVNHLWKSGVSPMQFTYTPTGAQILFRGLDDATKLKSIKPRKGIFKYIWFEEFCELPGPNFLRSVQQSVMRGGSGFVVLRSFNPPISQNNWANMYVREPDPKAITLATDYTMIPPEWLGEAFLYEAERLKQVNPTAYMHEYMGQATGTGGEVFPNLEIREITDREIQNMQYFYQGVDFGFAVDPACYMLVNYDKKHDTIYLIGEIYKRQCSNAQLAKLIKELTGEMSPPVSIKIPTINPLPSCVERHIGFGAVYCDSAEPRSIVDLRDCGIRAIKCYKAPGCVSYRVKWLQHRRLVIDPKRTPNAYREFVNYEYETDRDGNFLSSLPDRDNHSIDAVAYALNNLIFGRYMPA